MDQIQGVRNKNPCHTLMLKSQENSNKIKADKIMCTQIKNLLINIFVQFKSTENNMKTLKQREKNLIKIYRLEITKLKIINVHIKNPEVKNKKDPL